MKKVIPPTFKRMLSKLRVYALKSTTNTVKYQTHKVEGNIILKKETWSWCGGKAH